MLRQALSRILTEQVSAQEALRWGWLEVMAAWFLWDYDLGEALLNRLLERARHAGIYSALPAYLETSAEFAIKGGDVRGALTFIGESNSIKAGIGSKLGQFAAISLTTYSGQLNKATNLIDGAIREAQVAGQASIVAYAHGAATRLHISLGRYGDALTAATLACEYPYESTSGLFALPDLVEAAVRTKQDQQAIGAFEQLVATTTPSATDWALGIEARCRALLSSDDVAEEFYLEAIERLGRTQLRPELAHAHLLFGEWLRRRGRRIDARGHLRKAFEMFTDMEMVAFADRCRRESLATGERVTRRADRSNSSLTPQELQIAISASRGATNSEIATTLFLSSSTVDYHLRKVFRKLGIASRRQLEQALLSTSMVESN